MKKKKMVVVVVVVGHLMMLQVGCSVAKDRNRLLLMNDSCQISPFLFLLQQHFSGELVDPGGGAE